MSTATPDAPLADSSTATPETPAAVPTLATMTSTERAQWRLTGEKPASSSSDAVAASSPAPASDSPVSTDTSIPAASEPAKGKGVKARSASLDAEIADMRERLKTRALLREELARLDAKPDAPPASSPAPSAPALPDLSRPMLTEQEFFAVYPETAYGSYAVYAARYAVAEDRHQQTQAQQQQQDQARWAGSIASVRVDHPDYDVVVPHAFESLPDSPANRAIAGAIRETGNARLLYHLATHPEDTQRLAQLSPAAALMEVGMLNAQFGTSSASAAPVLKTRTDAPPPPPSVTNRAFQPASDIDAALAARDYPTYKRLANERDIATRLGRR